MNFEEDFQLIKELSEIHGCSGDEWRIRQFIIEKVNPYCDKIETDNIGNLYCYINGKANTNDPRLRILLDAHMDELGYMVRFIDNNGFIRFAPIVRNNPRILPGQMVIIHSNSGEDIIGIIADKASHLLKPEEKKKTSKIKDLFIDTGFSNVNEAKKFISAGDYITLKQECIAFKSKKRIFSKGFDDRIGCFVLIKLIRYFSQKKENLEKDLIFLFTVQEEIGVRGARVGAYRIFPDMALAVEVAHSIDYPGISKEQYFDIYLGCGTVIAVGPNMNPKITKVLIDIAKEEGIPFALEPTPKHSGTDARVIQLTKSGIPCGLISIPLRYMHTNVETIEYQDILHTIKLIKVFLLKDLKSVFSSNY